MPGLRLCFAGTPAFAAAHLSALLDGGHRVAAVYTRPDRPAGRGGRPAAGAVKRLAAARGLPVRQPASLNDPATLDEFARFRPELLVVVAYGLIVPAAMLAAPPRGGINVHASLLPRWRGAAPIERALLAGDRETGVSIMRMDEGLDTGPVLHQETVPILPRDDRAVLEARLCAAGRRALLHALGRLDGLRPRPQDDAAATFAPRIDKREARIDWSDPAERVDRVVRAGVGRLPAWSELDGGRLRILKARPLDREPGAAPGTILAAAPDRIEVACGRGTLEVEAVQLPGGAALPVRDVVNGRPALFSPGKRFAGAAE